MLSHKIQSAIQERAHAAEELHSELDAIDIDALEDIRLDAQHNTDRLFESHRYELTRLKEDELRRLRELNYFRSENALDHRSANYSESAIFHWGFLFLLAIGESALNSHFFAKGSDFGLVGGILQAMIISAINIGTLTIVGMYIVPNFHHVNILRRISFIALFCPIVALIFMFNMVTAHYRGLLESSPDTALAASISQAFTKWLNFGNFDAMVLFVVGILFAIIAGVKAYLHDDPYPKYGVTDRRYKTARKIYESKKQILMEETFKFIDTASRQVDRCVQAFDAKTKALAAQVAEAKSLKADWERSADQLKGNHDLLIRAYRQENQKVRSQAAPQYFGQPVKAIHIEAIQAPGLEERERSIKQYFDQVSNYRDAGDRQKNELRKYWEILRDKVQKYIEEIEATAAQQVGTEKNEIEGIRRRKTGGEG